MSPEEMFSGFKVAAGESRLTEQVEIGGAPLTCKVSSQDTNGAMCVFEFSGSGGPRHVHHDQDEWIYVLEGEFDFEIGGQLLKAHAGETVFLPRKVAHAWTSVGGTPGKVLDTYQPAGKIEDFYREVGRFIAPPIHEVLGIQGLSQLFQTHGMDLVGAPMSGKWSVDSQGRITRIA